MSQLPATNIAANHGNKEVKTFHSELNFTAVNIISCGLMKMLVTRAQICLPFNAFTGQNVER